MSVTAQRWAHNTLAASPAPADGGLSHAARAVLLVLAGDANADTGEAWTSATTIGAVLGQHERNVRRALTELAAWPLPRRQRPGRSDVWVFPPAAVPRAPAPGVDPAELSTPRAPVPGVEMSTPRAPAPATPGAGARGRDRRDVPVSTRRDPARQPPPWIAERMPYAEWLRRERAAGRVSKHNPVRPQ